MYDYYKNEYFDEPSEFEQKIDELKESLKEAVKEEVKERINRLEAEVKELTEVKKNWKRLKIEYDQKKQELEGKIIDAEIQAKRARIEDLFEASGMNVILYQADDNWVYKPKCNKCDKSRKIHFKSPNGKDCTEPCECSKHFIKYVAKPYYMTEFRINNYFNRDGNKYPLLMWFKPYKDKYDEGYTYWSSNIAKHIFNGEDYKQLEEYSKNELFFKSEEECQRYCDYLNEINGITEDMKAQDWGR